MKITFLGTGAADWKIQKHRDMEGFRRYSALLVDGCLLIDPNPNVPDALETFGKDPKQIRYIINTHTHGDHYCEETIASLQPAQFYPMEPGQVLELGPYTVSAFRGNHATASCGTVHFIISDGEKKLFYGLDGAWLLYEEVAGIKREGVDYAVLDATIGDVPGDYRIFEHNNLNMVLEMKKTLAPYVKRFCISHMARTLHDTHAVLAEKMKAHGLEVAFDGYETEI